MRISYAILFFLSYLTAVLSERPWEKFIKKSDLGSFSVPKLPEMDLIGGVKLYHYQSSLIPKVRMQISFEGGEAEEPASKKGLTSLMGECHVLSGSKEHPRTKLAEELEQKSSSFSFQNNIERISFNIESLSANFYSDLSLITEVITHPRFEQSDCDIIKNQILQVIKKRNENPGQLAYIVAAMKAYENTIKGRITTTKSISEITNDDLVSFHKRMVSKSRLTISVVGDFNLEVLKKQLNSFISTLAEGSAFNDKSIQIKPNLIQKKIYLVESDIPQTTVLFQSPGIPHSHPDYFAMKVYDFILGGGGFSAELMQEIRTKRGWAYSVYSQYSSEKYDGAIKIFAQTANKNTKDLINKVNEILLSPEQFVTNDVVEKTKLSLLNKFVFLYETPTDFVNIKLSLLRDGLGENFLDTYRKRISEITREEVIAVAKKYYAPDKFFISLVGPASLKADISGVETFTVPR